MEQYERLWQYQQVDMELDQYEKEMRGNSNRKELLKHRDFLLEQQNVLKKIEADVEIMGEDSLCPHMLAIGSLDLVIKGTLCILLLP